MAIDSVKKTPTIDPVKHGGIDHIKSLYFSDGWYEINEWSKCSECGHRVDDFGQNYCSNCGAIMTGTKPRKEKQNESRSRKQIQRRG